MKKKVIGVLSFLFGLVFINSGLNKFFNYMPVPDDLPEPMVKVSQAMTDIGWLIPLVAVVEIVAGALFLIPKFRALGAIAIFPVMVGILLTHTLLVPAGLPLVLLLLAIELWVILDNRKKYLPLIS